MKHFTTVHDVKNVSELIAQALYLKKAPFAFAGLGKNKTLGLIFMNPSLRTRLSTQRAAMNLGMNVMVMNIDKEGWALEFGDGAVMNGSKAEHVKDAAAVMGQYCDIIGIRCFPGLADKQEDYSEQALVKFMKYCRVPVISLESATLHPLQSLADAMTIREAWKKAHPPRIVLTWAPHIKALPQAVANSFAEWMTREQADLTIVQPEGFELCDDYTRGARIVYDQCEALKDADFVYVKNWSSYHEYGKVHPSAASWMLTREKLGLTRKAKVMHCLPVRRNVELSDAILDSPDSLVLRQAENRLYAAQAVIKTLLEHNYTPVSEKPAKYEQAAHH
ncbi:MAG: N-acetylornithine carbamoyltransferase [Bacteroidota bacterium]